MPTQEMTVITSVTSIRCDGPVYRLYKYPNDRLLAMYASGDPIAFDDNITLEQESVKGVRLHHPDGRRMVIGMTAEVYNVLGMPVDAMNNMNEQIKTYESQAAQDRSTINRYKNAKLWQRFLYLFIGMVYTWPEVKQVLKGVFITKPLDFYYKWKNALPKLLKLKKWRYEVQISKWWKRTKSRLKR